MIHTLRDACSPLPDPRAARRIGAMFVLLSLACIATGVISNISPHARCKCDPTGSARSAR